MFVTLLTSAIRYSAVFLLGSTGETIIEKSGHLNLGIPGIMCFGAVGGCVGGSVYLQSLADVSQVNPASAVLICLFFAMLFAGLLGLLYGFMTITLRCNQNITGLTITTFGIGTLSFWGSKNAAINFRPISLCFKNAFEGWESMGDFGRIFFSHGVILYVAIAIAIVVAIVLKKTRTGMNLCAIGENPGAADAAGINVSKYKYLSNILGAAIAGIGGLYFVMDISSGVLEYVVDAFGWIAVALVIFSLWRPAIGIFGSILFGALYILPSYVNITFAQNEIIKMVPYLATVVVLIIISIFNRKETQPPASLGVNYFREER